MKGGFRLKYVQQLLQAIAAHNNSLTHDYDKHKTEMLKKYPQGRRVLAGILEFV